MKAWELSLFSVLVLPIWKLKNQKPEKVRILWSHYNISSLKSFSYKKNLNCGTGMYSPVICRIPAKYAETQLQSPPPHKLAWWYRQEYLKLKEILVYIGSSRLARVCETYVKGKRKSWKGLRDWFLCLI